MKRRNEHIKSKFLEWSEGKLSDAEKDKIEHHLSECNECQTYFEAMNEIFKPDTESNFPVLEPDPFLPTRIKAIVKSEKEIVQHKPAVSYLRWLFVTLASSVAIFIGVMLGQGLYNSKQSSQNNQSVVSAYYQVYSQEGLSDNFESTLSTGRGNRK